MQHSHTGDGFIADVDTLANASHIAAAHPAAVLTLIDEMRRLKAENEDVKDVAVFIESNAALTSEVLSLRAENERMRRALKGARKGEGMMKSEIEAAVKWWSGAISGNAKNDAGDAHLNMMIGIFSAMDKKATPTKEQLDLFEAALTSNLVQYLHDNGWDKALKQGADWCSYFRSIGVDYGPPEILASAARAAGISERAFPIKTVMWIDPGKVSVRNGYGAEAKVIYSIQEPPK